MMAVQAETRQSQRWPRLSKCMFCVIGDGASCPMKHRHPSGATSGMIWVLDDAVLREECIQSPPHPAEKRIQMLGPGLVLVQVKMANVVAISASASWNASFAGYKRPKTNGDYV